MTSCYLYLVLAADGSRYTGISDDPERRICEHNQRTRGANALRGKRPVSLLRCFRCGTRVEALRLEVKVKALDCREKWSLSLSNDSDPEAGAAGRDERRAARKFLPSNATTCAQRIGS